jgi:kynureninase
MSTPSLIALAPLAASLEEFDRVGMDALGARSQQLTGFLERAITERGAGRITPAAGARRGCQLSVWIDGAKELCARLRHEHNVVCDFREPNVLRFAPVPLYTTYAECSRAAEALAAVTASA